MTTKLGPLELANPVMVASGTFGYGVEYSQLVDVKRLGAVVTKTITPEPREGNATPRICETPSGMLNSIGLENPGIDVFADSILSQVAGLGVPVVVNVAGNELSDYVALAGRLSGLDGVAALELNVSCPNVKVGGMLFGVDAKMTGELVAAVRAATSLPIITKLTPNVTDIASIAKAAEGAGSDAVSCTNTLLGMAVDVEKRVPRLATVTGGLSGPAIGPVSLRCVWQVAKAVSIPVVGVGGIATWQDAAAMILAGATAVEVGTATFADVAATSKVLDGLESYMERQGFGCVTEMVGALEVTS